MSGPECEVDGPPLELLPDGAVDWLDVTVALFAVRLERSFSELSFKEIPLPDIKKYAPATNIMITINAIIIALSVYIFLPPFCNH